MNELSRAQQRLRVIEARRDTNWVGWSVDERDLNTYQWNQTFEYIKLMSVLPPFGERELHNAADIEARLLVPLNPDQVLTRPGQGGAKVVYIDTHTAVQQARAVFGEDGFTVEVKVPPAVLFQGNGRVCVQAVVRVTLANGCFHEDVGVSTSTLPDPAEALKQACKSSVSDATKRALQHFGPALGGCLRDPQFVRMVTTGKQRTTPVAPQKRMLLMSEEDTLICEAADRVERERRG